LYPSLHSLPYYEDYYEIVIGILVDHPTEINMLLHLEDNFMVEDEPSFNILDGESPTKEER
jgi:hypothetical protein